VLTHLQQKETVNEFNLGLQGKR